MQISSANKWRVSSLANLYIHNPRLEKTERSIEVDKLQAIKNLAAYHRGKASESGKWLTALLRTNNRFKSRDKRLQRQSKGKWLTSCYFHAEETSYNHIVFDFLKPHSSSSGTSCRSLIYLRVTLSIMISFSSGLSSWSFTLKLR